MKKISTIFFDAGFTLVRIQPSLGAVYARIAADLGVFFPADRFQEIGIKVWNEVKLPKYRDNLRSSDEIERQYWWDYNQVIVQELEQEGLRLPFEAWFEGLYEAFALPETWTELPGTTETLKALQDRGVPMGVISNWDSRLGSVLAGLGLDRFFRVVLTSAEAGFRKPHPRIFEIALEAMKATPGECIHVGDSAEDDVAGARAAGIRPVRLLNGKEPDPADACLSISTMPGLLEHLDGLS